MGVQGGRQQSWDLGLGSRGWGAGWGLTLMVVVDRGPIVWNDRRGGGENVGSWGRSRSG